MGDVIWQRLGTRTQLFLLVTVLPGVLLHEVVHYLAWGDAADEKWIDPSHARTHAVASDASRFRRVWTHLAPTVVGWCIAPLIWTFVPTTLSAPAMLYGAVNYLLFATPSPADLRGAWSAITERP